MKEIPDTDFYTIDSVKRSIEELGEQTEGHKRMLIKYGGSGSQSLVQNMFNAQAYAEERGPDGVLADAQVILRRYKELSRTLTDYQLGLKMDEEFGNKVSFLSLVFREGPIEEAYKAVLVSRDMKKNIDARRV